jgi:hypothetical protein
MGELELHEYFDSLPPAEQDEIRRAVQRLERCSALDMGPLDHMPIKGHARCPSHIAKDLGRRQSGRKNGKMTVSSFRSPNKPITHHGDHPAPEILREPE